LLRAVTGEGWNELMHALSRDMVFFTQSIGEVCVPEDTLYIVDSNTYPILQQKCLIDEPSACGKDFSYFYFITFTCVMTMVMVNLMIAVILEAFSDSSSNELVEVIEDAIRIWPKYDRDLELKITLAQTFEFINAVATESEVDLTVNHESKQESPSNDEGAVRSKKVRKSFGNLFSGLTSQNKVSEFRVADVPLRMAKLCEVKVSRVDGSVHFLYAMRMAVALTLSSKVAKSNQGKEGPLNSSDVLKQFEEAELKDERLQQLRSVQVNRCIEAADAEVSIPLPMVVGAAKIQTSFRATLAMKRSRMRASEALRNSSADSLENPTPISGSSGGDANAGNMAEVRQTPVTSFESEPEQDLKPREAG